MFPGDVMDHHVSLFQQGFLGSYFDNTFTNNIDQTTSAERDWPPNGPNGFGWAWLAAKWAKWIWLSVIDRQMGQMDLAERDWSPNMLGLLELLIWLTERDWSPNIFGWAWLIAKTIWLSVIGSSKTQSFPAKSFWPRINHNYKVKFVLDFWLGFRKSRHNFIVTGDSRKSEYWDSTWEFDWGAPKLGYSDGVSGNPVMFDNRNLCPQMWLVLFFKIVFCVFLIFPCFSQITVWNFVLRGTGNGASPIKCVDIQCHYVLLR